MLKLTQYCLYSFIVAIIEITWSAFDLAEEAVVFFFNSEAVGKFFIKVDKKALISLSDGNEEQLTKSEFFYWLLLLVVIIVNCLWVYAALKLMYGIIKVIFQDDRLRGIKCCRFWFQFSWLLLIIFGVKIFRNSSGFGTFFSALGVVIYRGVSMALVHAFAKELELAELIDPQPNVTDTNQIHYNSGPSVPVRIAPPIPPPPPTNPILIKGGSGGGGGGPQYYEQPMAVFDVHRV